MELEIVPLNPLPLRYLQEGRDGGGSEERWGCEDL
jgi:hypothetical protein